MKKKFKFMVGTTALAATIATSLFIGSTLAKYTTTVSGSDTASAARFAFKATTDAMEYTSGSAKTIDIFSNSNLTDYLDGGADGSKIAPGSAGDFSIVLDNSASDVDIDVTSEVTASFGTGMTLKFYIANSEKQNIIDTDYTIVSENFKTELETNINTSIDYKASKTVYIYWKWFDGEGNADNTAGGYAISNGTLNTSASVSEASITIAVTAAQKQTVN